MPIYVFMLYMSPPSPAPRPRSQESRHAWRRYASTVAAAVPPVSSPYVGARTAGSMQQRDHMMPAERRNYIPRFRARRSEYVDMHICHHLQPTAKLAGHLHTGSSGRQLGTQPHARTLGASVSLRAKHMLFRPRRWMAPSLEHTATTLGHA